jgi:hypothetical protein
MAQKNGMRNHLPLANVVAVPRAGWTVVSQKQITKAAGIVIDAGRGLPHSERLSELPVWAHKKPCFQQTHQSTPEASAAAITTRADTR